MTTATDSWRRPVYVNRKTGRFYAEPLIGGGVWPEVPIATSGDGNEDYGLVSGSVTGTSDYGALT
jgi:hypothetical protein